jgi:two-component system response regulator HydG
MDRYNWPGNVRELRNLIESMVVQDSDGVLDLDDLQEGDSLRRFQLPEAVTGGPADLVGRPLTEVERYYIEKALELTGGNREEAASRLGIGERTLYRVIQDWKVQDQIKAAMAEANGDLEKTASTLGMSLSALQRKIKKLGMAAE